MLLAFWQMLATQAQLDLDGRYVSCDMDMHHAAVLAGMQGLREGTLWPLVPELHLGWDGYGLYCWPLFCLLSAAALALSGCGVTDPVPMVLDCAGLLALGLTVMLASWTAAGCQPLLHGGTAPSLRTRNLAWLAGGLVSLGFLNMPAEQWFGFGRGATFGAGLLAQSWGWVGLLSLAGASLRLAAAPRQRCWLIVTALAAAMLFTVHSTTALAGCILMLPLLLMERGSRWRLMLAGGLALLLVLPYFCVLIGRGSSGLPSVFGANSDDPLLESLRGVITGLVRGELPAAFCLMALLGSALYALGWGWRTRLRPWLYGTVGILLVATQLDWSQWLPIFGIWYRLGAPGLLLLGVLGAGLACGPLAQRWASRTSEQRWAAALAILLGVLTPAWQMRMSRWQDDDDIRPLLARVPKELRQAAFLAYDPSICHRAARLALEDGRDFSCGAQITFAGTAYQILSANLIHAHCKWWAVQLDPFVYPKPPADTLAIIRDYGVAGVLQDRRPALGPNWYRDPELRLDRRMLGWTEVVHGEVSWWSCPDPLPLVEAVPWPLLCIPDPKRIEAELTLAAWWQYTRVRLGLGLRAVLDSDSVDIRQREAAGNRVVLTRWEQPQKMEVWRQLGYGERDRATHQQFQEVWASLDRMAAAWRCPGQADRRQPDRAGHRHGVCRLHGSGTGPGQLQSRSSCRHLWSGRHAVHRAIRG